jgi:hypothetical protein
VKHIAVVETKKKDPAGFGRAIGVKSYAKQAGDRPK